MTDKPQDIGIDSEIQAKTDIIDLNNEIAGIDNGKQWRFLSNSSPTNPREKEKKKFEREFRNLLDMLLAEDPLYAALYKKVTEKLDKAQQAVDRALIDINQRLEDSDRNLQFLRDNAAELPDGTKVFKSNDGSIYTEHGKRLSDEKTRNIRFSENAPSWETYKAEKEVHDIAAGQKQEVETYQREVLDSATKRMNDKDNPPSMDELKELETQLENEMPNIMKSNYHKHESTINVDKVSTSVAHGIEKTQLNVPDMTKSFDLARVDIPNLGDMPENTSTPTRTLTS